MWVQCSMTLPDTLAYIFADETGGPKPCNVAANGLTEIVSAGSNGRLSVAKSPGGVASSARSQRGWVPYTDLVFNELISKGAFKAVYRGKWNSTQVAIVCMRKGGLITEARILQLISNHPNLVQFFR